VEFTPSSRNRTGYSIFWQVVPDGAMVKPKLSRPGFPLRSLQKGEGGSLPCSQRVALFAGPEHRCQAQPKCSYFA